MYKLAKYLYELGQKNERKQIQLDLLYYIGQRPERWHNQEAGMKEAEEHFKQRIETWNTAKTWIERFFEPQDEQL